MNQHTVDPQEMTRIEEKKIEVRRIYNAMVMVIASGSAPPSLHSSVEDGD